MSDGTTDSQLESIWQASIDELSQGARVWTARSRPVSLHNGIVIVATPNETYRNQLETRVRQPLEQALTKQANQPIRLIVTIDPDLLPEEDQKQSHLSINDRQADPVPDLDEDEDDVDDFTPSWANRPAVLGAGTDAAAEARLNPRYQFDTFVIGQSNRFAHAAAVAAAEAPGKTYNPLVIYGDSGLGKTHLLHAIGHYVLGLYPTSRVRYVNTEEFTNDVIDAIQQKRTRDVKRKYRDVDVLLVDDIQFIENKEATQEEFFNTFNALHLQNKQIVMTSDRPPKNLRTLADRLRNRFEWGLTTDVTPPDLETRIAILRKKAAADQLTVPADVLEFIASKVQTNIRELEGALIRATAFANLNKTTVDLNLAQIVLKDLIAEGADPEVTIGMIMAQTAAMSEFSIEELCGTSRTRDLVLARQISMYLCREMTQESLPTIGKAFGGRDHTTVLHAERKIGSLMKEKHAVYNQVTELTNRIKQQARQT